MVIALFVSISSIMVREEEINNSMKVSKKKKHILVGLGFGGVLCSLL